MAELVSVKQRFVAQGFRLEPASNGGMLMVLGGSRELVGYFSEIVTFSTPADMLKWLTSAYEEKANG